MNFARKDLLLRDLCTRIPYGVIGEVFVSVWDRDYDMDGFPSEKNIPVKVELLGINENGDISVRAVEEGLGDLVFYQEEAQLFTIEDFKPFLRPLNEMTEEELDDFTNLCNGCYGRSTRMPWRIEEFAEPVDWLTEHHFDLRGLLKKGLAIEVTPENNPYKL